MVRVFTLLAVLALNSSMTAAAETAPVTRRVISLNGSWQIAAGPFDQRPDEFHRTIPVPGVVDMAMPPFENVGKNTKFADDGGHKFVMISDPHYRAFWYRKVFTVDGDLPPVALLKLAKAKYGTRVWLNGEQVGEHLPCFTPGYFNVREQLKVHGQANELIVRVGADPLILGDRAANGFDFEKHSYLAGIYDDVTLILTGAPYVVNVQVVPEIERNEARVVAELLNAAEHAAMTDVTFEVRPYKRSDVVGHVTLRAVQLAPGQTRTVEARVPIRDCKLWTPETPNLYHLVTRTNADTLLTRFGMRRFHFDPETRIGMLNGKRYYLRGSNVCYFRFEEDPLRADKPWDEQWVRTLHRRFKSLHMNALRYCIGFPPEMWYRIADEEGIIIQDEFPIWTLGEDAMTPVGVKALADEYREWMREHWNHACVLIWDAQNECRFDKTREAIGMVRHLDLSNRPWDNGWGKPHRPDDIIEDHPYQYSRSMAIVHWNPELKPLPTLDSVVDRYSKLGPEGPRPRIVNEYAWLWLRRDGQPTTLTRAGYAAYLPAAGAEERRAFYARCLSAMTEALRSSRHVAGVLYFCGLGHSWDGCATSDNFADLERLEFEPHFLRYMQYAFAPVGLMLRLPDDCRSRQKVEARVVVFNDLDSSWSGDISISTPDGKTITVANVKVPAYGRAEKAIMLTMPDQHGRYEWSAQMIGADDKPVLSRRLVTVEREDELVTLANVEDPGPITADEPMASEFSAKKAAHYLDTVALHWQKTRKCVACHVNMGYMFARPALSSALSDSGEVRTFFEEHPLKRWKEKPPRHSQEVVVVAASLVFNDLQTTGKLAPATRQALKVMWQHQRDDGGWNWRNDGYPPVEYDEHYGVTLAALTTGIAPDRYAETKEARDGLKGIKLFLEHHPPKSLHHRAMIAWASRYIDGLASDEARANTLRELLAIQRPDGGWSTPGLLADWEGLKRLDGKPHDTKTSDAYATGFALIVARELGASADQLRRGTDWLLANQRVSGKWYARSPAKDSRHYFSNLASAFAILGLQACGELPGWPLSR